MTPTSEDDEDEEWTWTFAPRAADQFDDLDHHVQDRIVSKLDEVVESEWRDPGDYLEPLTGGPFEKLRVGQYRLACVLDHDGSVLEVHRIEHRQGAYTADD
jgi:mRNA-degrading endonuclease RelE of RelBE toxin-antitoxin system